MEGKETELDIPVKKYAKKNFIVKLKKSHTHAGTLYPVGTPLETLNASPSTIDYLKKVKVI